MWFELDVGVVCLLCTRLARLTTRIEKQVAARSRPPIRCCLAYAAASSFSGFGHDSCHTLRPHGSHSILNGGASNRRFRHWWWNQQPQSARVGSLPPRAALPQTPHFAPGRLVANSTRYSTAASKDGRGVPARGEAVDDDVSASARWSRSLAKRANDLRSCRAVFEPSARRSAICFNCFVSRRSDWKCFAVFETRGSFFRRVDAPGLCISACISAALSFSPTDNFRASSVHRL